jgi:hypothetical protein
MAAKSTIKKLIRPRWLLPLLLVAVTVPLSLVVATSASPADQIPVSSPAHPVVDARWIYDHDWFDANNFIYKVAGADGCLPQATTCGTAVQSDPSNNLPENYNGAQEFYSWWKGVGTTSTPQPNGKLGLWITARDHLYPTRVWQLDDAELTIPGATCAGQQVMLASHNDSTGVSAVNTGTSPTPMSGMHGGNWGNGSAYDANMGENMNLEELGSVLRWHEVNGTYPARTIKATLYDNEEGGLVGSGDYSAAGGGATLLQKPVSAGDSVLYVASAAALNASGTNGIFGVGSPVAIDDASTENGVVQSIGTGAQTPTTLASAASAGDTNVKVVGFSTTTSAAAAAGATNIKYASSAGIAVGGKVTIDTGANAETVTVVTVGSTGAGGGGLTVTPALTLAHASGSSLTTPGPFFVGQPVRIETLGDPAQEWDTVQSVGTNGAAGTGIGLASPLSNAHASGAQIQDLGTGVTLASPVAQAHPAGSTVNGPTTGLLSDSPQGQIIGVFNNDQDGLNYPALHWGTDHYLNDLVNGGIGPWFNNINATPISAAPNSVYGTVGIQRLQHNLPAVVAFRTSAADAVTNALHDLGEKYNFSIPVENPLLLKNAGSVPDNPHPAALPAYLPADQALYTPVLDDRTGRTDQVSFGIRGIPSLGDIGQYDSSTDPLVGGAENPYPASYPSKPTLQGMFGQDSTSDYFSNLNFWASGTVHGPGGFDSPSEGLLRGVEFIATWFSYAIASDEEGGKVAKPNRPIAYFEMSPKKPTAQTTVTFDAGFSRAKSGDTDGLTYYWDFGDGSPMVKTSDPLIQHTFPTQAAWRDVKLLVAGAGQWNSPEKFGSFRQLEPIDFFPTYYPAVAPSSEPLPPSSGSAADPCGALTPDEQSALIDEARDAKNAEGNAPTLNDVASVALRTNGKDETP